MSSPRPDTAQLRLRRAMMVLCRSASAVFPHETQSVHPEKRTEIDRATADDVMSLVSARHDPPVQVGAVLLLDVDDDADAAHKLAQALAHRIKRVPRLRQRLVDVPIGCGRPIWVDFPEFNFDEHFAVAALAGPITEERVLAHAAEQLTTRLPQDRPLWAATLLTGRGDGRGALVLVFHHVLADGIAGLSVLGRLVDGAPPVPVECDPAIFPRRAPSLVRLAAENAGSRVRSVPQLPVAVRRLVNAVIELGPSLRTQVAPCSLNRPTGPHRQLLPVTSSLTQVIALAHQNKVTVNDVILTAITGALEVLLADRGEHLPAFVVSIPVAARPPFAPGELGNHSGVVPVLLPASGAFLARLESIASITHAAMSHQRGASTALLSPVFRLLARSGLYQHFIDHQRLIHTFVSDLKGPDTTLTLLGLPITSIVALSVATGNVTVGFTALSYAGSLVITISADPDTCTDGERLQHELQRQLDDALGPPPT